ncbi:MAG: glycosyltransferase [Eubacteriales bacterium]
MKKEEKVITKRTKQIWFFVNTFCTVVYLIWRGFFTLPLEHGWVSIILGLALFIVEIIGMAEAIVHFCNMKEVNEIPLPVVPEDRYPHVDIFVATYNESEELLYKTINGCKFLEYPDKNKVHIYLCDDSRRSSMKQLAETMGVSYFDRPNNDHAKAGNLNSALGRTKSPLVVTLDADMIPNRDFLMKTVPYFVQREIENEKLEEKDRKYMGFVQSPQAFYNPDLFQSNLFSEGRIPNEQDYFYRDIQVARNSSNSVIYGGSNTVLSRSAINDIGGFYTDSITEDYSTGILMQKKKYVCIAISEVLATGLSPTDMQSLISQRVRWGRGVIQSNRKLGIWRSKELTFAQKMNYWASKVYWYSSIKRLIYFLSPLVYILFGYMVVECTIIEVLIFWLPMYLTSNISLKLLSDNIRSTKWTGIYETAMFPFTIVPITLETFGISMKKFVTTSKDQNVGKNNSNFMYLMPFALFILLSVAAVVKCFLLMIGGNAMGLSVIMFWLIFNLYLLIMAAFFVSGRAVLRKSERSPIQVNCTICLEDKNVECVTGDISESGFTITLEKAIDLPEKEPIDFTFNSEPYDASVNAKLVYVRQDEDGWKYAFYINDYKNSYGNYLQIFHDRVPTLPQKLSKRTGVFDDLRINMMRRLQVQSYENRKKPRVDMDVIIKDEKGKQYHLADFNYQYISLHNQSDILPDEISLILPCEENIILKCVKEESVLTDRTLYHIKNYDKLSQNSSTKQMMEDWVFTHQKINGI